MLNQTLYGSAGPGYVYPASPMRVQISVWATKDNAWAGVPVGGVDYSAPAANYQMELRSFAMECAPDSQVSADTTGYTYEVPQGQDLTYYTPKIQYVKTPLTVFNADAPVQQPVNGAVQPASTGPASTTSSSLPLTSDSSAPVATIESSQLISSSSSATYLQQTTGSSVPGPVNAVVLSSDEQSQPATSSSISTQIPQQSYGPVAYSDDAATSATQTAAISSVGTIESTLNMPSSGPALSDTSAPSIVPSVTQAYSASDLSIVTTSSAAYTTSQQAYQAAASEAPTVQSVVPSSQAPVVYESQGTADIAPVPTTPIAFNTTTTAGLSITPITSSPVADITSSQVPTASTLTVTTAVYSTQVVEHSSHISSTVSSAMSRTSDKVTSAPARMSNSDEPLSSLLKTSNPPSSSTDHLSVLSVSKDFAIGSNSTYEPSASSGVLSKALGSFHLGIILLVAASSLL